VDIAEIFEMEAIGELVPNFLIEKVWDTDLKGGTLAPGPLPDYAPVPDSTKTQ
jgi:hypothetical protein